LDAKRGRSPARTGKRLSLGQLIRDLGKTQTPAPPSDITRTDAALLNPSELPTSMGIPTYTISIEQRFVGSIVGKNGESMKQIERSTGAVVKLDHSSKASGLSVCRIYGPMAAADRAADLIRVKLAAIGGATGEGDVPEGFAVEDFPVEHGLVGLVMGKAGESLKQIMSESGAEVTFDKMSETKGEDRFRIVGRRAAVDAAKRLIRERIGALRTVACGAEVDLGAQPGSVLLELPVQQQFVGRIIGKNKETLKEISERTGARIEIEQSTQDQGFSTVRITGLPAAAEAAKQLIENRAKEGSQTIAATSGDDAAAQQQQAYLTRLSDDAVPVEQRFVGFIIGPGGRTLRQIKEQSGAKIVVDQETREQGYSIVRIGDSGSPENLKAKELIEAKIQECQSLGQNGLPQQQQPPPPPPPPPPQQPQGGGGAQGGDEQRSAAPWQFQQSQLFQAADPQLQAAAEMLLRGGQS